MAIEETSHTIQIKVEVTIDIQRDAKNLEDAIAIGGKLNWADLLHEKVDVADGHHEVVGVWDNSGLDYNY